MLIDNCTVRSAGIPSLCGSYSSRQHRSRAGPSAYPAYMYKRLRDDATHPTCVIFSTSLKNPSSGRVYAARHVLRRQWLCGFIVSNPPPAQDSARPVRETSKPDANIRTAGLLGTKEKLARSVARLPPGPTFVPRDLNTFDGEDAPGSGPLRYHHAPFQQTQKLEKSAMSVL